MAIWPSFSWMHLICNHRSSLTLFSRDTVWSVMTGRPHEGVPSIVMHDVREIETWILRLLSAPVCVPGKTRVEVRTNSLEAGGKKRLREWRYTAESFVKLPHSSTPDTLLIHSWSCCPGSSTRPSPSPCLTTPASLSWTFRCTFHWSYLGSSPASRCLCSSCWSRRWVGGALQS